MKYVNANEVLPEELLVMIQEHYDGGYLYIPKHNGRRATGQTAYKKELAKRDQRIFLMHLEGRSTALT